MGVIAGRGAGFVAAGGRRGGGYSGGGHRRRGRAGAVMAFVLTLKWRQVSRGAGSKAVIPFSRRLRRENPTVRAYPVMPPGTCRESSWVLAACYPELEYVEGHRTVILHTTEGVIRDTIEHAWNVTRRGEVVDSTLGSDLRQAAAALEYLPGDPADSWPASIPDAANAMAAAARSQTLGRRPAERRKIVEAFGEMFRRLPKGA